jgi:hypothetical protein
LPLTGGFFISAPDVSPHRRIAALIMVQRERVTAAGGKWTPE